MTTNSNKLKRAAEVSKKLNSFFNPKKRSLPDVDDPKVIAAVETYPHEEVVITTIPPCNPT